MVSATQRVVPVLLLSATLLIVGVLYEPRAVFTGLLLLLALASIRGYVVLAYMALGRASTSWLIKGGVEGELAEAKLLIENKTWVPVALLEVSLNYSPHLKLVSGSRAGVLVLPPKSRVEYRVVFQGRTGKHVVGPLRAVVRDPFGLFKSSEVEVARPVFLEVKPKALPLVVRKLFAYTRSTGLVKVAKPGIGVEFYDTRDYMPGDELRSIDWKKYSLMGKLVVKEYERESYQVVVFVVDATAAMLQGPYGNTPFEHSARVVSSIAYYLSKRGDVVGLVAYGEGGILFTSKLARGKKAFYNVLRVLSQVEFAVKGTTSDEDRSLRLQSATRKLLEVLPRERCAVFIFTTSGGERYARALLDVVKRLTALGMAIYVVLPIIVAYDVKALTPWARAVFRVKTLEKLKQDLEFASMLRKMGAKVIAVGPELIPQAIVSIIEASAG